MTKTDDQSGTRPAPVDEPEAGSDDEGRPRSGPPAGSPAGQPAPGPTVADPDDPTPGIPPSASLAEAVVVALAVILGTSGCWSLILAQLGAWSLTGVLLGAAVITSAAAGWLLRTRASLTRPPVALVGLLVVIAIGLTAVVLPGNRVSVAGTDPGVYVQTARSIAESGDLDVPSPIARYGLEGTKASSSYPGLLPSPHREGRLDFAFYHLYPALAAPAYAIGRTLGLTFVSPVLGVLGALGLTLVLHRLRGLGAAAVGGGFLAFSYLWTFYSDWNGSEIPTATFLLVGLLAGLIGWDEDRSDAALVAGLLAGIAANGRPDGVLVILAAVGLAAVALNLGRRRLALAGLAGLVPPSLLWGVQSYDTTVAYAKGHHVPDWELVVGASIILLGAAYGARRLLADQARYRRPLDIVRRVTTGAYVAMLVGFWIRSQISEPGSREFIDYPSWYPFAAQRLTWFLTPVALVLFLLGLVEMARARTWRPLAMAAPGLAVLPLYLWQQRISAFMIWAMRRFVPLVWPMMGLLVGLGAALLLTRVADPRRRLAATGLLVIGVVAPQLRWTLPLHDLREYDGGFDEPERIHDTYGDGLYVWIPGNSHNMLVVPLFLETGGSVVSLQPDADADDLAEIRDRVDPPADGTSPGEADPEGSGPEDLPVFVLGDSEDAVRALGAEVLGYEWVITHRLELTFESVPTEEEELSFLYVVGQLAPNDAPDVAGTVADLGG